MTYGKELYKIKGTIQMHRIIPVYKLHHQDACLSKLSLEDTDGLGGRGCIVAYVLQEECQRLRLHLFLAKGEEILS